MSTIHEELNGSYPFLLADNVFETDTYEKMKQ